MGRSKKRAQFLEEREQLGKIVFDACYLTGNFTLRSGTVATAYFDKYRFESNPVLLDRVVGALQTVLPPADTFDMLAGLELGGVPLAVMLAQRIQKPVVFVRKKAKEYGTRRLAEGTEIDGKRLLIIEDVVTSGGQVVLSTQDLRERGATVTDAVCVINRESSGAENLSDIDVTLHWLFTKSELERLGGVL